MSRTLHFIGVLALSGGPVVGPAARAAQPDTASGALARVPELERDFSGLTLWYEKPAQKWVEALPIGNGRMGAMIFGGPEAEHLQLNEDTLYSGEPPADLRSIDIGKSLAEVVGLLRANKHPEADAFVMKNWLGRNQQCYQPLGDLHLTFPARGQVTGYRRWLDLASATAGVSFQREGVTFRREIFASAPDQVIVVRLRASTPGALAFTARFTSVHPTARSTTPATRESSGKELVLAGQLPGFVARRPLQTIEEWGDQHKYPELYDRQGTRLPHAAQVLYGPAIGGKGMLFEARLAARTDGKVVADPGALRVEDASEAVLFLGAGSSWNGFRKSPSRAGVDPARRTVRDLRAAETKDYALLHRRHVDDYRALFGRVSLELERTPGKERLPTDQRLAAFGSSGDPALAALVFQFGRYLLIAGSRPGTQALNLQGIWNDQVVPPWASAYTININTQMNYWPVEVTNLSELHEPLFRLVREAAQNGALTARKMYRARGWVLHHNTTIWRDSFPVDGNTRAAFWNMAGGWFSSHFWEHYLFSGDRQFLAHQAYPLMKGAAEFYADWLVDAGDGSLVTPVSTSPENRFISPAGGPAGASQGVTMDLAIIRELFTRTIEASELLGRDATLRHELRRKLARLAPYKIGARGQLQEWLQDYPEFEPKHRHLSHLYPFHPGNQINPESTPALFRAVARTLLLRGDEATGWSMGWKLNFWARMRDGDHAYAIIRNLFKPVGTSEVVMGGGGLYPNLFDAHPPFQIDGNFGYTAGVAELLLQSHAGTVHLLPALPGAWPAGRVTGLRTRGGFDIDAEWAKGRLKRAVVRSRLGGACRLRTSSQVIVSSGSTPVMLRTATGANPNPFFRTVPAGAPIIPARVEATLQKVVIPETHTIDFDTRPGEVFTVVPAAVH
jgi:alpha-L-fucosidase 2